MRLALYQPDIPQNVGSIIRLCACTGVPLDIIEPCGFAFDDRRLRRSAMDYYPLVRLTRHSSWGAFQAARGAERLVLLTTQGAVPYTQFSFRPGDILLLGQESCGAAQEVHAAAQARIVIPLRPPARSLNVAMAAAMALGEALRQREANANGT